MKYLLLLPLITTSHFACAGQCPTLYSKEMSDERIMRGELVKLNVAENVSCIAKVKNIVDARSLSLAGQRGITTTSVFECTDEASTGFQFIYYVTIDRFEALGSHKDEEFRSGTDECPATLVLGDHVRADVTVKH